MGISELLESGAITIDELFAGRPELEGRIRAAARRDDALVVIVTRTAQA